LPLALLWDKIKTISERSVFGRKRCLAANRNSSAYLSIRAFSSIPAAGEVLRSTLARIVISVRSAHLRAARFAKEPEGNLKTNFPFKSKLLSTIRSIQKNNSQSGWRNPKSQAPNYKVSGFSVQVSGFSLFFFP
jgi:hypothetical protein